MQSAFRTSRRSNIRSSSKKVTDETYDLRGLNQRDPDQIIPPGESPYNLNCRMYARQDGDSRVAIRTRRGSSRLSTPVGEALSTQNVATSTGDQTFGVERVLALPFTAAATGRLTKLEVELKKISGAFGHIMITLRADQANVPGTVISETSILSSVVTTSYQYLPAYFMDAPGLVSGTQYWITLAVQDNGSGLYNARMTADAGTPDLVSTDTGTTWGVLGSSWRYKTYISTIGGVKGFVRRYPSTGTNLTIISQGSNIIGITNAGATNVIDSTLDSTATFTRFEQIDDKTIWVNGKNNPRYTSNGTSAADLTNAPPNATHVIAHKNRLFFVTDKVLVKFSELYNFTTYPSVNFFYVPNPKSTDPITGWLVFQDNLAIFTHETKFITYGSNLTDFQMRQAVGTKGAISQEAMVADRNYIYFMADDKMIYRFNGVSDELISEKVEPELQSIQNVKNVRLSLYRNQLRVYYAKTPDVDNNRMLLLDLTMKTKGSPYGAWFTDTGRAVAGSLEWTQDDNELIEVSSRVGAIYRAEQGYSDLGKPIDWRYWTAYKNYGSGLAKKRVKSFNPILRTVDADYTMQVGKDVNFENSPNMRDYIVAGGGAKWGSGKKYGAGVKYGSGDKLIDKKAGMSGRARHIQFRFERKGVETPVEMYGYAAQVKVGPTR